MKALPSPFIAEVSRCSQAALLLATWLFFPTLNQCFSQGTFQITFDGPPPQPPETAYLVQSYSELGFWFVTASLGEPGAGFGRTGGGIPGFPDNGSAYLYVGNDLMIVSNATSNFDLISVDLAGWSVVAPDLEIRFVGYRADGSTVTTEFSGSGINFQTYYFSPEFSGLVRVDLPNALDPPFRFATWSMDNLVVFVPEPNAGALAVLGAIAFGFRFLRKTRRSD
jgi:hypothetical protein